MRAVIQRVLRGEVRVDGAVTGRIDQGLVVYLGVGEGDVARDADYVADKIAGLRVFEDDRGKMNLAVGAVGGAVLLVPQFTLYGDLRQGRRPGFDRAMEPVAAEALYQYAVARLRGLGVRVETGVFRAHMHVDSVNDGPVTLLLDSSRAF